MKHLKLYEDLKHLKVLDKIKKGDYVIMNGDSVFTAGVSLNQKKKLKIFLKNNMGEVTNVNKVHNNISVKYHDVSFHISNFFQTIGYQIFQPYDIVEYAKTPEELRIKIELNKYNL